MHIEEKVMFSGTLKETPKSNSILRQALEDDDASIYFGECLIGSMVLDAL